MYELTKHLYCGKELPVKLDYSRFDNMTSQSQHSDVKEEESVHSRDDDDENIQFKEAK